MKILYLCHPESDYGEYYLFNGLCQVLGDENVVTFPYKKSYFGETHEGYLLDDGSPGNTSPGMSTVPREKNEWSYQEIKARMKEFSFTVLSSPRTLAVQALHQLRADIGDVQPLIFTDHEDHDIIRKDILTEFSPDLVFKREYRKNVQHSDRIFPLPFSCPSNKQAEVPDSKEKDISVFALFGNTWNLRCEVIRKLTGMEIEGSYIGINNLPPSQYSAQIRPLLSYKDYLGKMSQAKINISVRGFGIDTCRRWEVPYYSGLVICDILPIRMPHDFTENENIVYFRSMDDLEKKVRYYLEHDSEREAIGNAGREHLLRYHTNEKRAEYFLDTIKKRGFG